MKKLISLLLVLILAGSLALTSCSSKSSTLRVATDATWPPFEYVDTTTSQIVGFDIDLFNAVAKEAGLKVEFVNVAWDPLLAGMAQGTYDAAISSITITADRAKSMLFSDPYFAAGQIVTVQLSNISIESKYDLSGKTVGVQLGTTGDIEVQKIAGATAKPYDDIGLAFQDLMNGQIDAVVCDNPVALSYVGKNATKLKIVGKTFTDENYGIAMPKGSEALQEKINTALRKIKQGSTIADLTAKWLEK